MQQKKQLIQTRDALIVAAFLAVMMVVGSIWDYPISQALYNQSNWFGIFFAAFGELPGSIAVFSGGLMLILGRNKERKAVGVCQIIGGVLLGLLGAVMVVLMPGRYLPWPTPVSIAVCVVIAACVALFTRRLCKNADRKMVIRLATIFILVVVAEMVLVNIVKIPWGRPRMRLMDEYAEIPFTPWWVAGGSELKDSLIAGGVSGDEFKSFPSGHTANGKALMMLGLLPMVKPSLYDKRSLLFFAGAVWGVLVVISRIIMGAHFVTDTTIGFTITFIVLLVINRLVSKNRMEAAQTSSV